MKNLLFLFLLACPIVLGSFFVNMGCGSSSPSGPSGPTATPTCNGASGNIGLNSTDGTNTTTTDHMYTVRYQLPQAAHVTDIRIDVCGSAGTTFNVGIYSDAVSAPATLVSPVLSQEVTSCSAVTLNFSGNGVALPAGYYWLAVGSTQGVMYYFNPATGTNQVSFGAGSGSIPSVFPSTSVFSYGTLIELSADWVCP